MSFEKLSDIHKVYRLMEKNQAEFYFHYVTITE
jgi:hypothetical protein